MKRSQRPGPTGCPDCHKTATRGAVRTNTSDETTEYTCHTPVCPVVSFTVKRLK